MESKLFSQEAMDNLSTPEKLDQQVKLISPGVWALFWAIFLGVAAIVVWVFVGIISSGSDYMGVVFDHDNVISLNVKANGVIQDILVDEGDSVSEGDVIAVIYSEDVIAQIEKLGEEQKNYEAGSEEYKKIQTKIDDYNGKLILRSNVDGIVQKIQLKDTGVVAGDCIATIIPESLYSYNEVYIYVPKDEAGALKTGMQVQITPSYVTREEYGYMEGVISDISNNIVTENHIIKHMGTLDYVKSIMGSENCVEVTIQLSISGDNESGYVWSNPKGESLSVKSGDQCKVRILQQEYHPYELLIND